MQKVFKIACIGSCCLLFVACSTLKFPWVYQVRVQQGNWIEREMVDQLEVGMSKPQVRYVMGTPLIQDTFAPDRWDYYFTVKQGEKQMKERRVAVFFENEKLARWESNLDSEKNRDDPSGRTEDSRAEEEHLDKRDEELDE